MGNNYCCLKQNKKDVKKNINITKNTTESTELAAFIKHHEEENGIIKVDAL